MPTNTNTNTKTNIENIIKEYLESLNTKEKEALEIAKTQLESSFDLEKSIGFIKFLNSKKENQ